MLQESLSTKQGGPSHSHLPTTRGAFKARALLLVHTRSGLREKAQWVTDLEATDEVLVLDALDDLLGGLLGEAHLVAHLRQLIRLLLAQHPRAQRLLDTAFVLHSGFQNQD